MGLGVFRVVGKGHELIQHRGVFLGVEFYGSGLDLGVLRCNIHLNATLKGNTEVYSLDM